MNIKKFFAPSSREALRLVREALGADAIVLSNRTVDGGVELVALAEDELDVLVEPKADAPIALQGAAMDETADHASKTVASGGSRPTSEAQRGHDMPASGAADHALPVADAVASLFGDDELDDASDPAAVFTPSARTAAWQARPAAAASAAPAPAPREPVASAAAPSHLPNHADVSRGGPALAAMVAEQALASQARERASDEPERLAPAAFARAPQGSRQDFWNRIDAQRRDEARRNATPPTVLGLSRPERKAETFDAARVLGLARPERRDDSLADDPPHTRPASLAAAALPPLTPAQARALGLGTAGEPVRAHTAVSVPAAPSPLDSERAKPAQAGSSRLPAARDEHVASASSTSSTSSIATAWSVTPPQRPSSAAHPASAESAPSATQDQVATESAATLEAEADPRARVAPDPVPAGESAVSPLARVPASAPTNAGADANADVAVAVMPCAAPSEFVTPAAAPASGDSPAAAPTDIAPGSDVPAQANATGEPRTAAHGRDVPAVPSVTSVTIMRDAAAGGPTRASYAVAGHTIAALGPTVNFMQMHARPSPAFTAPAALSMSAATAVDEVSAPTLANGAPAAAETCHVDADGDGDLAPASRDGAPCGPAGPADSTATHTLPPAYDLFAQAQSAAPVAQDAGVLVDSVLTEMRSLCGSLGERLASISVAPRRDPVRAALSRCLLAAGFSPQLVGLLLERMPSVSDEAQALGWVKATFERNLPVLDNEDALLSRGGVFALMGPTGVGKTTTTAKLAARAVMRHGADRVALLTTDSYRIGAHEQLRIYGRILGVAVHAVKDAADLALALSELRNKHMVLIDTIGMSQRDRAVPEQVAMLSGTQLPVQRLLLLNATSHGDTLDEVVGAYGRRDDQAGSSIGLAGCIITKLDEANGIGAALDTVMRHRLPVHYLSNGQKVPEDLQVASRAALIAHAFDAPRRGALFQPDVDALSALLAPRREAAGAPTHAEVNLG